MSLSDLIRSTFFNLSRRKLRSFLTIFAVVIGAGLVSLLVSLGIGTQNFLTAQIRATMPPDVLMVASSPDAFQLGLADLGFGGSPQEISNGGGSPFSLEPLMLQDIEDVRALEHVERVDPYIFFSTDSVRLQGSERKFQARVRPQPEYQVRTTELLAGTYFTDQSQGDCIIANQYLDAFGFERPQDAVGQEILVQVREATSFIGLPSETRDYNFTIAGVTEKTLMSTRIVIPVDDGKEIARFWADNDSLYTDQIPAVIVQVKVEASEYVDQVARQVEDLGLGAITSADVLGLVGTIFTSIQAVLSVFGLIALGVASLGIINTLTMAIYERTREIGVMKAVGASKATIRQLFTMEGAAIGLAGGLIGAGIGYGFGLAVNRISRITFLRDFETFEISAFPWWLFVGVVALSTVVALLAALYPSHRAAGLDPIEALRYE